MQELGKKLKAQPFCSTQPRIQPRVAHYPLCAFKDMPSHGIKSALTSNVVMSEWLEQKNSNPIERLHCFRSILSDLKDIKACGFKPGSSRGARQHPLIAAAFRP